MTDRLFYTEEEYKRAAESNLLAYLRFVGHELQPEGTRYFRSKLHSSLVIRNDGAWSWNEKDESGKSPVSLVSKLLQAERSYDEKTAYITAVKNLAAFSGYAQEDGGSPSPKAGQSGAAVRRTEQPEKRLEMPQKATDYKRAIAYLCQTRKIDYDIVKKLIGEKKILQEAKTNNVGFVAYDEDGQARHVFLRSTMSARSFKKDAPGSDKTYAFSFGGSEESKRVYVFEAAIDALSHATLAKRCGKETSDYRITLNGVSTKGLDRFLEKHPKVQEIVICTDNDAAGDKCAANIVRAKRGAYQLRRQRVPQGKDWNEYLVSQMQPPPPPRAEKSLVEAVLER